MPRFYERARKSSKYKEWRLEVYKRDNFQCQKCKSKERLHPHHIKSFAKYPELRYSAENGQTLCEECHGKIHGIDYNKNKISLSCKNCNQQFKIKKGHYNHQFCSKKCWYKFKSQITSPKKGKHYPHLIRKPLKICPVCDKEFRATWHKTRKQKYCSLKCWKERGHNWKN